jgi:glyoxalase family protein
MDPESRAARLDSVPVRLDAFHHITMITGDARRNVEFYAGLLGLRLVKQTVNFDQPNAYHLYFGDEAGQPGSLLTWFEFPGARPGRAGDGTIHLIQLGVGSPESLDFWARRIAGSERAEHSLRFRDYDGLAFELVVAQNPPLRAAHAEIPAEHAITGVAGARAYAPAPASGDPLLTETLGFEDLDAGEYRLTGQERSVRWAYDPPPAERARSGAGSVHHIAWACRAEDQPAWQARVRETGAHVTDVRDRDYFTSIYFDEPRGVLFEIATLGPGFAVDEDPDHLGESLKLPRRHEHLRERLLRELIPLVNPRAAAPA